MLYGRSRERQELEQCLLAARSDRSSALVLVGDSGIGKTALLDWVAAQASGGTVLRVQAVEFEARLPYAALHLLIAPLVRDKLDALPVAQAEALRCAFRQGGSVRSDRFLVGLATLSLLSGLPAPGPRLCLIDDAQWLDRASADALLFAARRLDAEGIVMIFAGRSDIVDSGLRHLRIDPLPAADATRLLSAAADDLAPQVGRRILADAAGNPLALLELAAALTPEQRSGGLGPLPSAAVDQPGSGRTLGVYRARIGDLPRGTRDMLLVAAADEVGDLRHILSAGELMRYAIADLEPAESAGLVRIGLSRLEFRHPLVRTAAYQVAPRHRRLAAHRALASTLDRPSDADRRAWQLAAATIRPDPQVADELEQVGDRARHRRRIHEASLAYERAGELTPDNAKRSDLLITAAELAAHAGQLRRARLLIDRLPEPTVVSEAHRRARVLARTEFGMGSPSRTGQILISEARRADRSPLVLGMLIDAARNALFHSDAGLAHDTADALARIDADVLAGGMATVARLVGDGDVDSLDPIRDAVEFLQETGDDPIDQRLLAGALGLAAGDEATALDLGSALADECRERGWNGVLPQALAQQAQAHLASGSFRQAQVAATEAQLIVDEIGHGHRVGHLDGLLAVVAAVLGDEAECSTRARQAEQAEHAGTDARLWAAWARGVHQLGLGRSDAALEHLVLLRDPDHQHRTVSRYAAPDLIEAAVRADRTGLVTESMSRYLRWATASGRPWAAAVACRLRGLVSKADADAHYKEALRLLESAPGQQFQRARTEFVLGEWQRRRHRRADARALLHSALDTFARIGATSWCERARAELQATGESLPSVRAEGAVHARLTPQELQVVRLAASGLSNREIAAELFLSPRTVGHHLYRAYPKLGVASRKELAELDLVD